MDRSSGKNPEEPKGHAEVLKDGLQFSVNSDKLFKIPVSAISNSAIDRNEATFEFSASRDSSAAQLTEMRFHVASGESANNDPISDFHDEVHRFVAEQESDAAKTMIALVKDLKCVTPRGRLEMKLFESHIAFHGKTYDYKIPLENISRLFLVPHKDGLHIFLVLSLSPPVRQGQTRYHFLIFEFPNDEEDEVELTLTQEQLAAKMPKQDGNLLTGYTYDIVCKLLRAFVDKRITVPGVFLSHFGSPAIAAANRQSSGFLYPLEKGFLYIPKPALYLRYDEVASVSFDRSDSSTRSFDFIIETVSGQEHIFSSIEKAEYDKLHDYINTKQIRIRTRQETKARNTTSDYDEDEGGDSDDASDYNSDEDADYDPGNKTTAGSSDDVDMEEDSDVDDEQESDDDDHESDDELGSGDEAVLRGEAAENKDEETKERREDEGDGN